jgi:hypothetical protein
MSPRRRGNTTRRREVISRSGSGFHCEALVWCAPLFERSIRSMGSVPCRAPPLGERAAHLPGCAPECAGHGRHGGFKRAAK